jgi:hypothetical protein
VVGSYVLDNGWKNEERVWGHERKTILTTFTLSVPQYLQRPTALVCFACGLLIAMYLLPQPTGLEWFLPMFYLKVLVSHLPKEEPYRPAEES